MQKKETAIALLINDLAKTALNAMASFSFRKYTTTFENVTIFTLTNAINLYKCHLVALI
jgi:hypothetical protein